MNNSIDSIVKVALLDEVKEISNTEDTFYKIEEEISQIANKKVNHYRQYCTGFGYKKHLSIAACLLFVCAVLMFTYSSQTVALASQVLSSIKTIFSVEKVGNELLVIEKPTDAVFGISSVGKTTQKGGDELAEKLGFSVKFPRTIGGSFKLDDKSLGILLKKQLDYDTSSKLQDAMFAAIENDDALVQLKPYNPVRFVSATYIKSDKSTIFINISQSWRLSDIETQLKEYDDVKGAEAQKIKVGNLDGYWLEFPTPVYPTKIENGIGKMDMSAKPEIKDRCTLIWEKSNIIYMMSTTNDTNLTIEESLKIAEDFMKSN